MNAFFKNHIYIQSILLAIGVAGWIFNLDKTIPETYAIICYVASLGLIVLNVFKFLWIRNKKFKWGLNATVPQLTFYGLLIFLIYFRFFGTDHTGISVKIFAIVMAATLLIDTFTKENKYYQP